MYLVQSVNPSIGVNLGVMGNPPPVMLLDADKLAEKTW